MYICPTYSSGEKFSVFIIKVKSLREKVNPVYYFYLLHLKELIIFRLLIKGKKMERVRLES